MYILHNNVEVINVDNDTDLNNLIASGWKRLTPDEVETAGMEGYEHLVSPLNTTVDASGKITFTPPHEDIADTKKTVIAKIDDDTSAAILAGFNYSHNGETLHFSYDAFDQQNFLDTATACQLARAGGAGIPTTVVWNAYTPDGTLKQLELDADSFLALYTQGALVHKSTVMAAGGAKKAKVRDAATADELKALVAEWGLTV